MGKRLRKEGTKGRTFMRRASLLLILAVSLPAASASPAAASITLGQLAPSPVDNILPGGIDLVPFNVASGNGYQVPGSGSITSWSHNAPPGNNQMIAMKVFRKVAEPNFYRVIGHDGPRPLAGGLLNTFPASIPVQAGDLVGLLNASSGTAPLFTATGADTYGSKVVGGTGLNDGQEASFNTGTNARLNVTAIFVPTNTVTLGKTALNKKKGTATLNLTLPNPGVLTASGNGVKASSAGAVISKSVPAGPVKLVIRAKGKKRKTLNETGKVKLRVAITYTPTGGEPSTRSVKVKLKKT